MFLVEVMHNKHLSFASCVMLQACDNRRAHWVVFMIMLSASVCRVYCNVCADHVMAVSGCD